jgi:hypothetical protein
VTRTRDSAVVAPVALRAVVLVLAAVRRALAFVAVADLRVAFRFRVAAAFWPLVGAVV